jgi:thioredoxin 1
MQEFYEVTAENFEEKVLRSQRPVLVDFSAEWCGPCKAAVPLLVDIKSEYEGEAEIVTVDIDKSPELRDRFGVKGVPTFLLFNKGELVETKVGASSRSDFCAMIDRSLESSK